MNQNHEPWTMNIPFPAMNFMNHQLWTSSAPPVGYGFKSRSRRLMPMLHNHYHFTSAVFVFGSYVAGCLQNSPLMRLTATGGVRQLSATILCSKLAAESLSKLVHMDNCCFRQGRIIFNAVALSFNSVWRPVTRLIWYYSNVRAVGVFNIQRSISRCGRWTWPPVKRNWNRKNGFQLPSCP